MFKQRSNYLIIARGNENTRRTPGHRDRICINFGRGFDNWNRTIASFTMKTHALERLVPDGIIRRSFLPTAAAGASARVWVGNVGD